MQDLAERDYFRDFSILKDPYAYGQGHDAARGTEFVPDTFSGEGLDAVDSELSALTPM